MSSKPWLLAVMGSTGSGKSAVAERIAGETGAQLISADAFQVYRGFDIGTNKPLDRKRYELLDVCSPDHNFGVGEYIALISPIVEKMWEIGRSVIIVGGTGLYVRALLEQYEGMHGEPSQDLRLRLLSDEQKYGSEEMVRSLRELDPVVAQTVDLNNPVRVRRALERLLDPRPLKPPVLPPFRQLKIAVSRPKDQLDALLRRRIDDMWAQGWVDEVRSLLAQGVSTEAPAFRAIGYHAVSDFVSESLGEEEAKEMIFGLTRRYAKRQRTWLRGEPRLVTFELEDPGETPHSVLANSVLQLLNRPEN